MNRHELAKGVYLNTLSGEKYKRTRLSLHFITKSQKETATAHALLPLMMERGYEACPDMTELSKKLAKLYGAHLSIGTSVSGENRILSLTVSGIKDKYALEGEKLSEEYMNILFGVAFQPVLENGVFKEKELEIEKQKLKEIIQSEINEKRAYCIRQAQRTFFEGSDALGIEKDGYLEEIDGITAKQLYEVYQDMIQTAQMEIFVIGADNLEINMAATAERPVHNVVKGSYVPKVETKAVIEEMDTVQGKVCLLFTTGRELTIEEKMVLRLAVTIFGASPISRLFMNVREKQSLCYYCAAGVLTSVSSVRVDSGVEHENAEKTINAVLYELDELVKDGPTEEELIAAKKSILNSLNALEDSAGATESWYFSSNVFEECKTPQETIKQIETITKEQIQEILSLLSLSVQYTLAKGGEQNA